MMKALGQRKGKIVLGRTFLDELSVEDLAKIFSNFFVLAIDHRELGMGDNLVYHGVSPFFDEIERGALIPEYLIEIE